MGGGCSSSYTRLTLISTGVCRLAPQQAIARLIVQLHDTAEKSPDFEIPKIMENIIGVLSMDDNLVLVAKREAQLLGMISIHFRSTMFHDRPSALIDELVVDVEHRHESIGAMLVNSALNAARKRNCCEVEVSTERSNSAAIEFYRKMGFEDFGVFLEREL